MWPEAFGVWGLADQIFGAWGCWDLGLTSERGEVSGSGVFGNQVRALTYKQPGVCGVGLKAEVQDEPLPMENLEP